MWAYRVLQNYQHDYVSLQSTSELSTWLCEPTEYFRIINMTMWAYRVLKNYQHDCQSFNTKYSWIINMILTAWSSSSNYQHDCQRVLQNLQHYSHSLEYFRIINMIVKEYFRIERVLQNRQHYSHSLEYFRIINMKVKSTSELSTWFSELGVLQNYQHDCQRVLQNCQHD